MKTKTSHKKMWADVSQNSSRVNDGKGNDMRFSKNFYEAKYHGYVHRTPDVMYYGLNRHLGNISNIKCFDQRK